ncbi:MAG: hypothetical protein AB7F32_12990 [Victivallaceae bacterium]
MNRKQLDAMLPEGVHSFDEWEEKIPKYQTPLMKRLDSLNLAEHPGNWTREALYEIVLWELNRFPEIGDALFAELGEAAAIPPGEHRQGKELLQKLLQCQNIGLTMATAILRFINPATFQTLNARNGHVVLGDAPYPSSSSVNVKYLEECADFYFRYLDELRRLTGEGFDFRYADRLLYQLDKARGRNL